MILQLRHCVYQTKKKLSHQNLEEIYEMSYTQAQFKS